MRPPNQMDETWVLARLREGRSAISLARELHVHVRRIAALARENGIRPLRRKRTAEQLARQDSRIRKLRMAGRSWTQIATALGYENVASGRIAVRNRYLRVCAGDAGAGMNACTRRHILRELRRINRASQPDDVDAFVRLARDPRRRWLLSPAEIELAKRKGLVEA